MKWRTGRRNQRIIYAQTAIGPSDDDPMIAVVETVQLAQTICLLANAKPLTRDVATASLPLDSH